MINYFIVGGMIMKKKFIYIILSVLLLSLSVSLVDIFIKPDYFVKISIKVIAFLILPILFFVFNKEELVEFKRLFKFKKSNLVWSLFLGIIIYLGIVLSYFFTRNIIDYSNVAPNLTSSMGITSENLIYVTLYISFLNSFLEEFFFRGFGFITLKKHANRILAYMVSSLCFSVYHIGMMIGSFYLSTLLLLVVGLFVGGCVFNYLNEKSDNIYFSWIVHMFANFGINTVGFILFGIL